MDAAPSMPLAVPDVRQQHSYDCGHAALSSLASYFGVPIPTFVDLGVDPDEGTEAQAIISYLRRQGLEALSGDFDLRHLEHFTRIGRPVLVTIAKPVVISHYVVVLGINSDRVIVQDPSDGRVEMTRRDFLAQWEKDLSVAVGRPG